MKKFLLFFLLFALSSQAQNNFNLELMASDLKSDSLMIAALPGFGNLSTIYKFDIEPNSQIKFLKEFNSVIIGLKSQNNIKGTIAYPQAFVFSFYDPQLNRIYNTKPFFLEKGSSKFTVTKTTDLEYITESDSPSNVEYSMLKDQLKEYDLLLKPYQENDPKLLAGKHQLLRTYILKNPNSFVAFWEIVDDFSKYAFHPAYLETLVLLSKKVKKTYSYSEFQKMIDLENSTDVGGNFPDLTFSGTDKLERADFSKYNITLIDYWSTTCKPCIEDLPKLAKMYERFRDKKVNFISISDDVTPERMQKATSILKENNIVWKNYFDVSKEFPKKLNAYGYPLQILVSSDGKIIARKYGELHQIEQQLLDYLK